MRIRGAVQGVFFRDTVRSIASHYDVHGSVRNAGSDAVEIVAEGEPAVLDAFVNDVLAHPPAAARVEDVQSTTIPPTGASGGFYVTR